jgi:outer membrane protein assembly factor BamB
MNRRNCFVRNSPGHIDPTSKILILALLVSALYFTGDSRCHGQDVLTWHNDSARTGQNLEEKMLTLENVNPKTFGELFTLHVDGKVDAEPLYAEKIEVAHAGVRNVLFVATEHDSLYAFDADSGTQLWQVQLLKPGETPSDRVHCGQIEPEIGITSTPVIDLHRGGHGMIYVAAMSKDPHGRYIQRLHALNLRTGGEEFHGPVEIQATFPGSGSSSRGGSQIFDPKQYAERAALLLANGMIYTTWTSHCDHDPYNGWIISYGARTLKQTAVLDITPNGEEGAIWQSGAGPATDPQGNVYLLSANGTFDTVLDNEGFPSHGDFGNSFLKLSTRARKLSVADYFTPFDVIAENGNDMDLGSGGPVVLPEMTDASGTVRHLVVGAAKDRNIYLLDRDAMGKFNPQGNQQIYQEIPKALKGTVYRGQPTYFDGRLYCSSADDLIREFRFADARLIDEPHSLTAIKFAYPGASPSISANGSRNAILWAVENVNFWAKDKNLNPAVLHAYDATDLSRELYNSNQAPAGRDHFGIGNKFITPMIAHGKIYIGTTDGVAVFGLFSESGSANTNASASR